MRWGSQIRKQAHATKKIIRKQKQHLQSIKSEAAIRQIVLASQRKQADK